MENQNKNYLQHHGIKGQKCKIKTQENFKGGNSYGFIR